MRSNFALFPFILQTFTPVGKISICYNHALSNGPPKLRFFFPNTHKSSSQMWRCNFKKKKMFAVFSDPYLFAPSRRKNKFLAPFLSARHGSLRFFFLFRKIRNSIFGVPRPDKTRPPSGAVTNGCHADRCTDGDDGEWHFFFVRMFVENFRVTAVAGWQQTVATFCDFFFRFLG